MNKMHALYGGAVGLLLTLAALAIDWLGAATFGLPLIPFDLLEWMTRALPGSVITWMIEVLVAVLSALGMSLQGSSKPAEQLLSVAALIGCGLLAGIILFYFLRPLRAASSRLVLGAGLGAAVSLPLSWAVATAGQSATTPAWISVMWTVALTVAWGVAASASYNRIFGRLVSRREEYVEVEQAARRRFLIKLGGATAGIMVVGAAIALAAGTRRRTTSPGKRLSEVRLPQRPDALEPVPGTRPEYTPVDEHYRIDINLMPPRIDADNWRLAVDGLVENPVQLNLEDFYRERLGEPYEEFVTLSCISNPIAGDLIGTTHWTGLPLQKLIQHVQPEADARFLLIRSKDGFHESIPLELIQSEPRIMLAYLWDGKPLTPEHGFPLRIYIPNRYGMKQPKWITHLELAAEDRPGYWIERGWDKRAEVKATSVIDTITATRADGASSAMIALGGIAYAGARGISKVEVSVDRGPWRSARLREPLSPLTWVIWRHEVPFDPGEHEWRVRCSDGKGDLQATEPSDPHPDGATGIHSIDKAVAPPSH